MATPDYSLGQLPPSQASASLSRGLQTGMMLGQARDTSELQAVKIAAAQAESKLAAGKAAQEAAARAQQQADFIEASKNPTAQKTAALIVKYPSMADGLTKAYTALDDQEKQSYQSLAMRAHSAQLGGRPDTAVKILREAAVAYENSGMKDRAKGLEDTARNVEENRDVATLTLGSFLASTMGPESYAKTFETASTIQATSDEAKTKAEKAGIDAKFAERKALAEIGLTGEQAKRYAAQTNIEWARLKLDREKAAAEALATLQNRVDDATKLSSDAFKLVSDAGSSAVASRMIAAEADDLAKALTENPSLGGVEGTWAEKMKAATGSEDGLTALRQRFAGLKAKGIYQALGKGTKTDDDYAQFEKGFPADSASSAQKAAFLRGMAKAARFTAATEDAQADYVSRNGAPSNARADLVVGGVDIPAGTTYSNAIGMVQAAERQRDVDAATAEKAPALAKDADALRSKYKKAP